MIQLLDNNEITIMMFNFAIQKILIMNFKIVILSYLRSTKCQEKLSELVI